MLNQRFGFTIRRARFDLGLSQERLAEAAGLDRSYIGEIERGLVSPSLTTVVKLATALRVSASELVGRCEAGSRAQASSGIDGDLP